MRVSDDRYHRDRTRLDAALRLIGHEARTCLVRDARRRVRKQAFIAPFANKDAAIAPQRDGLILVFRRFQ